ncbi:MAG: cysteine hydrolase [Alphaproteobacteria bacterium]|nr:cysteine hydrolase [Alphaproteobacteria bacterium]
MTEIFMEALLVVDVQKAMFASGAPHDGRAVVARIAGLLEKARGSRAPVFFVQHDGGPGDEFCRDLPGFAICDEVMPRGEPVIVKTRRSAFTGSDLEARLRAAHVDHIVLCGMQTEFCINAALMGAVDRGFRVTAVRDAHTTFDSEIMPAEKIIALHHRVWLGAPAALAPASEVAFTA